MTEESREQLLSRLTASGRPVTARQLERWCKAHKVDGPYRRHVPGVRGSISRFPSHAFEQAAAIFDGSNRSSQQGPGDRRLRVRSFLLWWDGRPVAGDPRDIILDAASAMFAVVDRVRNEGRTEIADEPDDEEFEAFNIAEGYVAAHGHEPVRGRVGKRILRNLARQREDFLSVATTILTAALGGRPLFGGAVVEGETSLEGLVLKAIAADYFTQLVAKVAPPQDGASKPESDEDRVRDIFESVLPMTSAERLQELAHDLSDEELEAARKYSHVLLEDIPTCFQAFEVMYGKNRFAKTVRILADLPTDVKAYLVICIGALMRKYGRVPFESIAESCRNNMGQAKALCALHKAFPRYRQLFLTRNLNQLAVLPQEERDKMYQSIKHLLT